MRVAHDEKITTNRRAQITRFGQGQVEGAVKARAACGRARLIGIDDLEIPRRFGLRLNGARAKSFSNLRRDAITGSTVPEVENGKTSWARRLTNCGRRKKKQDDHPTSNRIDEAKTLLAGDRGRAGRLAVIESIDLVLYF